MNKPFLVTTSAGVAVQPLRMQLQDQITRINGIIITNKSDLTIALFIGKEFGSGTAPADDEVLAGEIASIPIANIANITAAFVGTPATAGQIQMLITSDSVPAYRSPAIAAAGFRVFPARINWPGGEASQLVQVPFPANCVRVWAIAGGAYVFSAGAVALPLVFDANGLPADGSFVGSVNKGGSDVFPLSNGTQKVLFVPAGTRTASGLRTSFGVTHLWPLDDIAGSPTAADLIGSAAGTYSPTNITYRQPALFPETDFSIAAGRNDGAIVGVTLPFDDPNPGGDFSVELTYKKTNDTAGFNPASNLWNSLLSAAGFNLRDVNNVIDLHAVFNAGANNWFWQGPNLVVGTTYHVVLTWSKTNRRGVVYLNGNAVGMGAGPGAPPLGAWGAPYTEASTALAIGSDAIGNDCYGGFEVAATYNRELTSTQVNSLYGSISGTAAQGALLASFSDSCWAPVSSKIP